MPRKTSRGGRQVTKQRRRTTPRPQSLAQAAPVAPPEGEVVEQVFRPRSSDGPLASAPRSAAVPTAPARPSTGPVRRPAVAAGASLSTDQVRDEVRYIRRDIRRMLLTTLVVLAFMVAANFLLS